jgi:hypothetical protein
VGNGYSTLDTGWEVLFASSDCSQILVQRGQAPCGQELFGKLSNRLLFGLCIDLDDDNVWGCNWVGHLIPYAGAVTSLTQRIFAYSPLSLKAVTSKLYSGCYQTDCILDT